MAKFELVRFTDPNDGEVTYAQFADDRQQVAVYTSKTFAFEQFGEELHFDSVSYVLLSGGEYADAVQAALDEGEVIKTA
ncbi:hypothetical protein aldrigsur_38 [Escherichia phage aldrigsur]|uniref:Uncharacterized protein n=1 Tax=Escherichia phage altidsur TaxID=2696381 RepID=A0A6B9WK46_9CAUD|nr:hypothetical protein altidsur_17 [Escherichia phage altidsur]QHR68512.1 hypothetical protein aldrigsur_38 [Escherichia phage aldrigsur]